MAVLVDVPMWPAHDRLWAHLVSDSSLEELHAFAERAGLPRRSFDLDHYDVPAERYTDLVVHGVPGTPANLKITFPEDLLLAAELLSGAGRPGPPPG